MRPIVRIPPPPAIPNRGIKAFALGLVLMSSACTTSQSTSHQVEWTHPEKDLQAFYHDDAMCLDQANKLLAEQLETARTDKNFCVLPGASKQLHRECMEALGWKLNQRSSD